VLSLKEGLMDWDDEFRNGCDGMAYDPSSDNAMRGGDSGGGLDPLDITDPASAYFLLSDDAQDEIAGSEKKKMKCRACGHRFMDEIYDRCPKCFSSDTEEVADETENRYW
jgi:hypothetical protein